MRIEHLVQLLSACAGMIAAINSRRMPMAHGQPYGEYLNYYRFEGLTLLLAVVMLTPCTTRVVVCCVEQLYIPDFPAT
jgi:hypothetical protein